jgi:uncharacterized membrane protein YciS (DUF1049 family)
MNSDDVFVWVAALILFVNNFILGWLIVDMFYLTNKTGESK